MIWTTRSPDVEVYEVSIESVAVVVQQIVPLYSKHHNGRPKSVEQRFHSFDAGLVTCKVCRPVTWLTIK